MTNEISEIQKRIPESASCWVLVDYENKNPIMVSMLGDLMLTRKIFMVIPKVGKPFLICHKIDTVFLNQKRITDQFSLYVYKTWKEMLELEKDLLKDYPTLCMDISNCGLLPRVSLADYGSVEYLISLGHKVVSSADLQQYLYAAFTEEEEKTQIEACNTLLRIKDEAFHKIKEDILNKDESDEYEIQSFICNRLYEEGYIYDDPAIVAINHNASDPHYGPSENVSSKIHWGDVVLIDMWAKKDIPNSVYGDITWMGYVGTEVPEIVEERFAILRKAVDSGFEHLEKNLPLRDVKGYEVDDVVRAVIDEAGYGEYFIHRTGHNISKDVSPHGPGANIDDYESHDERNLIENTSFSLEPGIYAPDFGMRSETDVYISKDRVPYMVGGRQEKVIAILSL